MTNPKNGPQLGARQRAVTIAGRLGSAGRYGSGGWGVSWSAWFGFGDAAEGDFEAEGAELADVVADLPADLSAALIVVRAEILIPHTGAG